VNSLSVQGRVVLYTSLAHGLVHVIELTYAALLLRIGDDFGQGEFMLGVIANVLAFTFGAGALPAGLLVDRLGSRRVITFYLLTAAVAAFLVGLSPNAFVLGVFLGLLGLSIGLYHPAGLALLAQAAEQRGMAFGYHGVAGNLGVALAPAMAIGLAVAVDWRLAYFVLAALALLMVLILNTIHLPEVERKPAATAEPVAARVFGRGRWYCPCSWSMPPIPSTASSTAAASRSCPPTWRRTCISASWALTRWPWPAL
jgi:MFS family permease